MRIQMSDETGKVEYTVHRWVPRTIRTDRCTQNISSPVITIICVGIFCHMPYSFFATCSTVGRQLKVPFVSGHRIYTNVGLFSDYTNVVRTIIHCHWAVQKPGQRQNSSHGDHITTEFPRTLYKSNVCTCSPVGYVWYLQCLSKTASISWFSTVQPKQNIWLSFGTLRLCQSLAYWGRGLETVPLLSLVILDSVLNEDVFVAYFFEHFLTNVPWQMPSENFLMHYREMHIFYNMYVFVTAEQITIWLSEVKKAEYLTVWPNFGNTSCECLALNCCQLRTYLKFKDGRHIYMHREKGSWIQTNMARASLPKV